MKKKKQKVYKKDTEAPLTVRIPNEYVSALDKIGGPDATRSKLLRRIIKEYIDSKAA